MLPMWYTVTLSTFDNNAGNVFTDHVVHRLRLVDREWSKRDDVKLLKMLLTSSFASVATKADIFSQMLPTSTSD